MDVDETAGAVRPQGRPLPGAAAGQLAFEIPSFAAIGVIGYVVDATITYSLARYLGFSPELARPPGFVVATIVNFLLNRSITFRSSGGPMLRAFLRYCLVASAGLVVNYAAYSICVVLSPRFGVPVTPAILPLFIAVGAGVAMVVTFLGFRLFAFRRQV